MEMIEVDHGLDLMKLVTGRYMGARDPNVSTFIYARISQYKIFSLKNIK